MRILLLIVATCVPAVAAVPHITPGQADSAAVAGSASLTGTDFGTKSSRIRRTTGRQDHPDSKRSVQLRDGGVTPIGMVLSARDPQGSCYWYRTVPFR